MTADVIRRAKEAIGEQAKDDYILAPSRHAQLLTSEAPELATLLERANMETLAESYEQLDGEAIEEQARFKRAMNRANWSVLIAGVLSAATLAFGVLSATIGEDIAGMLRLVCGIAAAIAGGLAAMWLYSIRAGNLLEAWMSKRAEAETVRLRYFNELVASPGAATRDIPLPLLKLEYFRRYQLDTQISFYDSRGKKHAASARRTLSLGAAAAFIAAISAGTAGGLGWVYVDATALAGLAVVGTALAAFASEREAMHQDRRNAERYARTHRALREVKAKLADVRDAILAQDATVLAGFVAAVHEQLSLEHRQWRDSGESSESAAARLEQALAQHKKPDQSAA